MGDDCITWIAEVESYPAVCVGNAGGGAGGNAGGICPACGGNKKHIRIAGSWCPKSKRARVAEKLKAEGDAAF